MAGLNEVPRSSRPDADAALVLHQFDSRHAWRMAGVAFFGMFAMYGIAYSFGAFFRPMVATFGSTLSTTSLVFSITVFLWSMLGPLSGHLSDRLGPRIVVGTGALVMGTGLVLTAFIQRLWLGYLTYGIGVGVGVACTYVPLVAMVGGWFMRRRNTALGVAVAGIGGGILCVPPVAAALIGWLGWRMTYVVFGAGGTAFMLACAAMTQKPPVHTTSSSVSIRDAVRTPAFGLLYFSTLLLSLALFVPFVYLPSFARDHGVGRIAAAALVSLIGGASIAGRLGFGALGDRRSVVRLYQLSFLALGLSYAIWFYARSYMVLVIFTLVMGAGYGGYVALGPALLSRLFGTRTLGTVLGALYTSTGFGALAGPPLAGVIVDHTGSYRWAIGFAFAAAMAAFVLLLPLGRYEMREQESIAAV